MPISSEGIVKMPKASPPAKADWEQCACEINGHTTHPSCNRGSLCQCTGQVRFGHADIWSESKEVDGSIDCSRTIFGEPVEEQAKECQCQALQTSHPGRKKCTCDSDCQTLDGPVQNERYRCKKLTDTTPPCCPEGWVQAPETEDTKCCPHGSDSFTCKGNKGCCKKVIDTPKCCKRWVNGTSTEKGWCLATCAIEWKHVTDVETPQGGDE